MRFPRLRWSVPVSMLAGALVLAMPAYAKKNSAHPKHARIVVAKGYALRPAARPKARATARKAHHKPSAAKAKSVVLLPAPQQAAPAAVRASAPDFSSL